MISLNYDRNPFGTFVNTALNVLVTYKAWNFLSRRGAVGFLRRAVLHVACSSSQWHSVQRILVELRNYIILLNYMSYLWRSSEATR